MAKNRAKTKQQPGSEFLLFENYSLSSSTSSFKNNPKIFLMYKKQISLFKSDYMINVNENKAKNTT